MELGVHLPLMPFGDEPLSLRRLQATTEAARDCGFAAISANDHLYFQTPWLDGPAALASVVERSGEMELATTIALVVMRGAVPLAKSLTALDVLSGGRMVAGVGPGSSARDYDAVGIPFDERWKRFDEAVAALRAALPEVEPPAVRRGGIPIWIGSWGSAAGMRRVARLADGWLASAYNTNTEHFASGRAQLPEGFPNALSSMWTWVTESRPERDRVLRDVLAPMLSRDPGELGDQLCVGSAEHCAALLSSYAQAGCGRVYLWPLGDEAEQLDRIASRVAPQLSIAPVSPSAPAVRRPDETSSDQGGSA